MTMKLMLMIHFLNLFLRLVGVSWGVPVEDTIVRSVDGVRHCSSCIGPFLSTMMNGVL